MIYESFNLDKELTKVDPVTALTSGIITKEDIGKTVYLSNSGIECQEWRIADINHDGTENTVDLVSKYTLSNKGVYWNNNYDDSGLRRYIICSAYNGFSKEIAGSIRVQSVDYLSNGILHDRIKSLSINELGCGSNYASQVSENGIIYPIFGSEWQVGNNLAICKQPDGSTPEYYWTRTKNSTYGNPMTVRSNGYCVDRVGSNSYSTVACIRFGVLDQSILEELSKPNPVDILTSGKITKDYIGFPVTLTNSAIECQEWVIADINHDGTSGTVDLISRYTLENGTRVFGDTLIYGDSSLRSWLNNEVYNGFTAKVKNALKTQNILSNGSSLNDKIKCPSVKEMGNSYNYYIYNEGTAYPLFGDPSGYNYSSIHSVVGDINNYGYYWTRSRYTNDFSSVWTIGQQGEVGTTPANQSYKAYTIACIRF